MRVVPEGWKASDTAAANASSDTCVGSIRSSPKPSRRRSASTKRVIARLVSRSSGPTRQSTRGRRIPSGSRLVSSVTRLAASGACSTHTWRVTRSGRPPDDSPLTRRR